MSRHARFAANPIGGGLVARDGGLTLTSLVTTALTSHARSDTAQHAGVHGAEFAFWGDAALAAQIGVVPANASLNTSVAASGMAWVLHANTVQEQGLIVRSGMPAVSKGDIVGVRVSLDASPTIEFYLNDALVATQALPAASAWHFAVSLATAEAGTLAVAVNTGQWQPRSAAALTGWQSAAANSASIKLSDWDYLSAATDSPAHARYEGLLIDGISTVAEIGFWPWAGQAPTRSGRASCRLLDADGLLDEAALADLQGIPVAVRIGHRDGAVDEAATVARYVVDRIEVQGDASKVVTLDDAHSDLDEVLASAVFLPNLPALAWKPQPVVIGAVASVPGLAANTDGTALFLADAPLQDVAAVMDRGDIMETGTWALATDRQQVTMASPPVGPVVADVSSIGPGMQPASLQQFLTAVFGRIGKSAWSSADAAAIDAATGYAGIGYYANQPQTIRQALAAVLPSYGAWWWQDDDGTLRFTRIIAPESYRGPLAFDITRGDMANDLVSTADMAPNLTRRMAYRPNAQALGVSDLVTDLNDVPQSRREQLTGLWRGQVYAGASLPTRYRHADTAEPFVSTFWHQADAQAEIDRVVGIYAAPRALYVAHLNGDPDFAPRPGQIGRLSYPRYGLEAGKQVLVRARTRNPATGEITLALWG